MTLTEVSGQNPIECEFKDYLDVKIYPKNLSVRIHNGTEITETKIDTKRKDILYGRRANQNSPTFNAFAQIVDGVLTITFHTSSSDNRITGIFPIEITKLETDEREYTNFKFK